MGIPGLYAWLRDNSPLSGALLRFAPSPLERFYFDINSVFHEVASETYKYRKEDLKPENIGERKKIKDTDPLELKVDYKYKLKKRITDICNSVKITDLLGIMVDGVAPLGKIQQQRQRRYRTAGLRGDLDVFDTAAFSPGTQLMMDIDSWIGDVSGWIQTEGPVIAPTILYSSHLEPGEGEHKIMDHLRANKPNGGNIMIYGMDADLIILCLLSNIPNIFISRSDIRDVINIDKLREGIMGWLKHPNAIFDFAIIVSLLGNDFLPHQLALKKMSSSLKILFDIYIKWGKILSIIPQTLPNGQLNDTGYGQIDWINMAEYLKLVAAEEPKLLAERTTGINETGPRGGIGASALPIYKNNNILMSGVSPDRTTFNYSIYRDNYYNNAFGLKGGQELLNRLDKIFGGPVNVVSLDQVVGMCRAYMTTLDWVILYYQKGESAINWSHCYTYHHAPLLSDLALVIEQLAPTFNSSDTITSLPEDVKFTPLDQLVSILHHKSIDLLPIELRSVFSSSSPIIDLLPYNFILEMEGTDNESNGTPIIPFIDPVRVIVCMDEYYIYVKRVELWDPKPAKQYVIRGQDIEMITRAKKAQEMAKPQQHGRSQWQSQSSSGGRQGIRPSGSSNEQRGAVVPRPPKKSGNTPTYKEKTVTGREATEYPSNDNSWSRKANAAPSARVNRNTSKPPEKPPTSAMGVAWSLMNNAM